MSSSMVGADRVGLGRGRLVLRDGERHVASQPAPDFGNAPALLWIAQQQPPAERTPVAFGDRAQIDAAGDEAVRDDRVRQAIEGMPAGQQFDEDHAERPVIGGAIEHARERFRRAVLHGACETGKALRGIGHRGDAEIGEYQVERIEPADQHVLRLHVAVDDIQVVQCRQCLGEFLDDQPQTVARLGIFLHQRAQRAGRAILHQLIADAVGNPVGDQMHDMTKCRLADAIEHVGLRHDTRAIELGDHLHVGRGAGENHDLGLGSTSRQHLDDAELFNQRCRQTIKSRRWRGGFRRDDQQPVTVDAVRAARWAFPATIVMSAAQGFSRRRRYGRRGRRDIRHRCGCLLQAQIHTQQQRAALAAQRQLGRSSDPAHRADAHILAQGRHIHRHDTCCNSSPRWRQSVSSAAMSPRCGIPMNHSLPSSTLICMRLPSAVCACPMQSA